MHQHLQAQPHLPVRPAIPSSVHRLPLGPPSSAPPASPGILIPVKTAYHTVPSGSDDDRDNVVEKEDNDSGDEEIVTRDTRVIGTAAVWELDTCAAAVGGTYCTR